MATAEPLYTFVVKDVETIRDDLLRSWRTGYIALGIPNPNVAPGSEAYVRATGIAEQFVVSQANAAIEADEILPDKCGLAGLLRWGSIFGLGLRPATKSEGPVEFDTTATTTVSPLAQLIDAQGLRYEVVTGGTKADGDSISIRSVDTGDKTELAVDAVLRWATAPAFAAQTVKVLAPGLKGGKDAEGVEGYRQRILAHWATPPAAGNWQHVVELAESASGSVEKCFSYPAFRGPGTSGLALVAAATATNKNRNVPTTTVSNVVQSVRGAYPEHADIHGTTVSNVATDVSYGLSLPASPTASPPGPGGGWLDGTPWPTRASTGRCDVTVVTSTTVFRVVADQAPTAGVTRVAWLSPYDWTLYLGTVLSFTDIGSDVYEVTIDFPFVGLTVGCFVWPQPLRAQAYVEAALDGFASMGPGEKTSNPFALERGFRHPPPSLSWPHSLGASQLRVIEDSGSEVLDTEYLYRSTTTPAVPGSITDPPNQIVPRHLGFYPK